MILNPSWLCMYTINIHKRIEYGSKRQRVKMKHAFSRSVKQQHRHDDIIFPFSIAAQRQAVLENRQHATIFIWDVSKKNHVEQ